jgi:hypothetical protein
MQPVRVCRATAEANVSGRVFFLKRLLAHEAEVDRLLRRRCQMRSPKAQDLSVIKLIRRQGRIHRQRVEDNAFHLCS